MLNMPHIQQQQAPQPTPMPPQQQPVAPTPQHEEAKPEFMNFDASQLQIPSQQPQVQQPQQQNERVGLATIPENDFSKLNINGFQGMNFNNYSVNAFAVTELPKGPDPIELLIESPVRLPRSTPASAAASSDAAASSTAYNFSAASDMTVLLAKLDSSARKLDGSGQVPI